MRLTVVGNSGSYPGPDSPASCYLLEAEDDAADAPRTWRILLDLGSGALGTLQQLTDPLGIDAVLLSHLHADHCLDLCGYYVMRKYHPRGPQPRIPVYGPEGTALRMAKAYDLDESPGMNEEFEFTPYPQAAFRIGPNGRFGIGERQGAGKLHREGFGLSGLVERDRQNIRLVSKLGPGVLTHCQRIGDVAFS